MKLYKIPLQDSALQYIEVPKFSTLLSCGVENGIAFIYYFASEEELEKRPIIILKEGDTIPRKEFLLTVIFLGNVCVSDRRFGKETTYHVFCGRQ